MQKTTSKTSTTPRASRFCVWLGGRLEIIKSCSGTGGAVFLSLLPSTEPTIMGRARHLCAARPAARLPWADSFSRRSLQGASKGFADVTAYQGLGQHLG